MSRFAVVSFISPVSSTSSAGKNFLSTLRESVLPLPSDFAQKFSHAKDVWNAHKNKEAILEEHRQEVLQAANFAGGWDIRTQLRILDAEVEKLVSTRS